MAASGTRPWMVSLHGGHCGAYCDHASGTLSEMLEAAVAAGYQTFGVSEHAPRMGEHLLYAEEREMGWDVAKLEVLFEAYARDVATLAKEFEGRLHVLRGFECEAVPTANYREIMLGLRERHNFEYIVGSVHHVHEITIDGPRELFDEAIAATGSVENLALTYYRSLGEMIEALKPEVVGHFDLVRKNAPSASDVETTAIRSAAAEALEAAQAQGCILDLNTSGYRKDLGSPYPAPWLVKQANEMGIGFCFGDDSHAPDQVGAGVIEAREYLLDLGVEEITTLARENNAIVKHTVSLRD